MAARWWLIGVGACIATIIFSQRFIQTSGVQIKSLLIVMRDDIQSSLPVFKGVLEALTALAMLMLLIILVLSAILLFSNLHPWNRLRETVIQFVDLRPTTASQPQKHTPETEAKSDHRDSDQAITELFAAKLRGILSIHDLAYQYCRIHFRNQEIYSSQTCADMTSIWSQVEIKSLFFEEPTRLAIGSSPFNEDLGQITTQAGPIAASLSLKGMLQFLQTRKTDNIFLSGSLQDHGDGPHVVSQLSYGKKTWAWDLKKADIHKPVQTSDEGILQAKNPIPESVDVPVLLEKLAYHATNRIMGQTSQLIDALPGNHFEKYSKLLRQFVDYIQSQSPALNDQSVASQHDISKQGFDHLVNALHDFLMSERTDVRSYYMLYIIGIIAIGRREYLTARTLLIQANIIEPSVLATILQTGISHRELKWKRQTYQQLSKNYLLQTNISKADRLRAIELAKGLANVNAALGFSFEQSMGMEERMDFSDRKIDLENAANAYKRAFEYRSDDPLFLSNQAEVNLRISDFLQPKDSFLEQRLRLREEAEGLLHQACRMKSSKNVKYAWLRLGNFRLSRADLHRAIECFKKAWDLDKNFLVAARNLANTYTLCGDYDQAILTCEKALQQVGRNSSHFLNSQQIHGWIHNCRGWAYLRKARLRRLKLGDLGFDKERESWLHYAQINFDESYELLSKTKGQTAIPRLNQLFVGFERALLNQTLHTNDFIEELCIALRPEQSTDQESTLKNDSFYDLYRSIIFADREDFGELFQRHWSNHTFVASEYFGLIEDLMMLQEYLDLKAKADCEKHEYLQLQHVLANLDKTIEAINKFLPSCFLGVNYLWYQRPEHSINCWKMRREDLMIQQRLNAPNYNKSCSGVTSITTSELNDQLWICLYRGLSHIISNQKFSTEVNISSFSQVLRENRRSSSTRQYALDLLKEAKYIGEILATRSPALVNDRQKANFYRLFKPVNTQYYRAVKADLIDRVLDWLKDLGNQIKHHILTICKRIRALIEIITA